MSGPGEPLPLFPLGMVLLPGESAPLHIFEERYRTMIGLCLDESIPFGVIGNDGGELSRVGCAAEITQLIERMADGRMNILVQGTRPFTLLRELHDRPYPAGEVEWLADDRDAEPVDPDVASRARTAYANLVQRVTDDRPDPEDLAALDAYDMAATIAFEAADKQLLLELRDEGTRLERLAELCEAAVRGLSDSDEASKRASTNGRVPH